MGKQTKKTGSKFGGLWTKQKLTIIEEYLKCYSIGLKNCKFKKIYIDAFAGSGITELDSLKKEGTNSIFDIYPDLDVLDKDDEVGEIKGSALISLRYDFDNYYFLELDKKRASELKQRISESYPDKMNKVEIIQGDSNKTLLNLLENIKPTERCLMFLDPYALELNWNTLKSIARGVGNDVWYLFPLHALTRVLPKDGSKLNQNEKLVSKILGTDEWENYLYVTSNQLNFLGEEKKDRVPFDNLFPYILERLQSIFPYVADEYTILRNSNNSPLFMLCFMMTNKTKNAQNLAKKFVVGIRNKMEKILK